MTSSGFSIDYSWSCRYETLSAYIYICLVQRADVIVTGAEVEVIAADDFTKWEHVDGKEKGA